MKLDIQQYIALVPINIMKTNMLFVFEIPCDIVNNKIGNTFAHLQDKLSEAHV